MRDCVFLVADEAIAAMVRGFLGREQYHQSLGCGPFRFDERQDLIVDPTRDSGVYTRGFELLAPFANTHQRAIVMLDAEWGKPTPAQIRAKIEGDLQAHWEEYLVIVLEPEVEAWIWQDNPHVCTALGVANYAAHRAELERLELWKPDEPKPFRPKEAVEHTLRLARIPQSAAIYRTIASRVSTRQCVDASLERLRDGLTGWFGAVA